MPVDIVESIIKCPYNVYQQARYPAKKVIFFKLLLGTEDSSKQLKLIIITIIVTRLKKN